MSTPKNWTTPEKIAAVMRGTRCSEAVARAYLIAEEGDVDDARTALQGDSTCEACGVDGGTQCGAVDCQYQNPQGKPSTEGFLGKFAGTTKEKP